MAFYRQPNFNLAINIFRYGTIAGATPPVLPPADVQTTGNLSPGRLVGPTSLEEIEDDLNDNEIQGSILMILRLPKGTDIQSNISNGHQGPDFVEVPAGSGRVYWVYAMDDIGKGFPNEHRFAFICMSNGWTPPVPFP